MTRARVDRAKGVDAALRRVDRMRRTRHNIFYDLDEVTDGELESALREADAIVTAARAAIGRRTRR